MKIIIEYDPRTVVSDSHDYDLEQRLREMFDAADINATITAHPENDLLTGELFEDDRHDEDYKREDAESREQVHGRQP
jgi:hypothetical protein